MNISSRINRHFLKSYIIPGLFLFLPSLMMHSLCQFLQNFIFNKLVKITLRPTHRIQVFFFSQDNCEIIKQLPYWHLLHCSYALMKHLPLRTCKVMSNIDLRVLHFTASRLKLHKLCASNSTQYITWIFANKIIVKQN